MVTSRFDAQGVLGNTLATANSIYRQGLLTEEARNEFAHTVSNRLSAIGRYPGAPPQTAAGTLESRSIIASGLKTGQIPARDVDVASTFQASSKEALPDRTVAGAYRGAGSAGSTVSNEISPKRGKSTPSFKPGGLTH